LRLISEDEVLIFDSTGTALPDVVAAVMACEQALKAGSGVLSNLGV
jgi:ornithine cyclodeaminase/alanine dehydrogenase-like protein (mu-crystallin family)